MKTTDNAEGAPDSTIPAAAGALHQAHAPRTPGLWRTKPSATGDTLIVSDETTIAFLNGGPPGVRDAEAICAAVNGLSGEVAPPEPADRMLRRQHRMALAIAAIEHVKLTTPFTAKHILEAIVSVQRGSIGDAQWRLGEVLESTFDDAQRALLDAALDAVVLYGRLL